LYLTQFKWVYKHKLFSVPLEITKKSFNMLMKIRQTSVHLPTKERRGVIFKYQGEAEAIISYGSWHVSYASTSLFLLNLVHGFSIS